MVGGRRPTWSWNFLSGALPLGSTFTRASTGYYFNNAGVLVSASNDVARFDYDPVTLVPLGYLAETQSTNGLLRSEDFTNASWTASGVTPTTAQGTAPDGNNTLNKLVESNTNAAHKFSQAVTLATATMAGFSWFVKASSRSKFYVSVQASATNYAAAVFDTAGAGTTASETSVGAGSGTIGETGIRNVGNGIYRVWVQAKVTGANPTIAFGLASLATGNTFSSTGDVTYAGDGSSFGYGWGTQFDTAGVGVTSYIPTAGATVTRSADVLTMPLSLMPGWDGSQAGVLDTPYRLYTLTPASQQRVIELDDGGATTNAVFVNGYNGASAKQGLNTYSGSVAQINVDTGSFNSLFTRANLASSWSTTRGVQAIGGSLLAGSVNGTFLLPVGMTTMRVGVAAGGGAQINGALESISYYKGTRSDGFVQRVSL